MPVPLTHLVIFSALLFLTGFYGALTRRNVVGILISIEIMINAVNINFIAFSRSLDASPIVGQVFVLFIIVLAATTAAVGLAIVLALYRNQKTVYTDEINLLKW
jgi:NADH:ubiquinone oxidoreductase subunit K